MYIFLKHFLTKEAGDQPLTIAVALLAKVHRKASEFPTRRSPRFRPLGSPWVTARHDASWGTVVAVVDSFGTWPA